MNRLFVKTSGAGEALIVLHGWGMNSSVWDLVREPLESRFKVSWIDLPGHGKSKDCVATSLSQIIDLLSPHIPHQSHLLGWSLGGLIAQEIACQQPDLVKSMSLLASTPRFSQADDWSHAMSLVTLEQFAHKLMQDYSSTLKRFIALQFMGVTDARQVQQELITKIVKKGGGVSQHQLQTLQLGLQLLCDGDYRQKGHSIPQHWMLAARDRLIPKEVINDLKLIRPDDQITLLENVGHAPFMTQPEAFLESLIPFINHYAG